MLCSSGAACYDIVVFGNAQHGANWLGHKWNVYALAGAQVECVQLADLLQIMI